MSIAAQTGDGVFKAFAARLQAGDLPMDAMRVSLAGEDSLTNSDKRLLLRTAQPLGSSDTEAQCRHIENAQAQLSAQLAQAKEAAQTNGKLYMAAGVLGGLLLVILLL